MDERSGPQTDDAQDSDPSSASLSGSDDETRSLAGAPPLHVDPAQAVTDRIESPEASVGLIEKARQDLDPLDVAKRRGALMGALFGKRAEPVRVGRFEVLEVAGAGAMGRVYIANDPKLDRKVALKRIVTDHLDHEEVERRRGRLLREAKAAAQLSHPNVVEIFDVGIYEGDVYVAMEFVEGQTLRTALHTAQADWRAQLRLLVQAGEGLAAAHEAGIVHRDFKPDNALVGHDGRVRVVDFGLAIPAVGPRLRSQHAEWSGGPGSITLDDHHSGASPISHSMVIGGTPAYMPPEQITGEDVGPACDQFAFCVVLYEALHGVRPFDTPNLAGRIERIREGAVEPPKSGHDTPAELRDAVRRGLAFAPSDRFPSMHELLAVLRQRLEPPRSRLKHVGAVVGATGVLGLILYGWPSEPELCADARGRFDAAWTPDRRAAIEEAFTGSSAPYAAAARDRVLASLDDYRDRWIASYEDACRQTHVLDRQTPEQLDLRMRCLTSRQTEFVTLADLLGEADDALIQRAAVATEQLREIERCDDPDRLSADANALQSADPQTVAQAEALRAELAELRAQRLAGRSREALSRADERVATTEALGLPVLAAELHELRGLLMGDLNDSAGAVEAHRSAFFFARSAGDDRRALLSSTAQIRLFTSNSYAGPSNDEPWEQHALTALERLGDDPTAEAAVLSAQASLRRHEDRLREAVVLEERALRIREELFGPDGRPTLASLVTLALLYGELDRKPEALALLQRIRAIDREYFGPHHPNYAKAVLNVGVALNGVEQFEQAVEAHREALAIFERIHGEVHINIALVLNNLGNALAALDRHEEAIEGWHRADRILAQTGFEHHSIRSIVLDNLGTSLRTLGRAQQSLESKTRALTITEMTLGSEHSEYARLLFSRSLVLLDLEREQEALADLTQAETIYEATLGPTHSSYAAVQIELGDLDVHRGEHERGLEQIERGIETQIAALGEGHSRIVSGLRTLGVAQLHVGRPADANKTLQRATQLAKTGSVAPSVALGLQFDLARAQWEVGHDRPGARRLAEQALAGQQARPAAPSSTLAAIDTWLAAHPLDSEGDE